MLLSLLTIFHLFLNYIFLFYQKAKLAETFQSLVKPNWVHKLTNMIRRAGIEGMYQTKSKLEVQSRKH